MGRAPRPISGLTITKRKIRDKPNPKTIILNGDINKLY